jgi:hypothetical protein
VKQIVLLHSSDDKTVPVSSSVRMHDALAGRGIQSRLLISTGSHCSAIMGNGCDCAFLSQCSSFIVIPTRSLFVPSEQRRFLVAQVEHAVKD